VTLGVVTPLALLEKLRDVHTITSDYNEVVRSPRDRRRAAVRSSGPSSIARAAAGAVSRWRRRASGSSGTSSARCSPSAERRRERYAMGRRDIMRHEPAPVGHLHSEEAAPW